jgi:putative acetyltransferase
MGLYPVTIRSETPEDIAAIHRLNVQAFDQRPNEARLVDLLRAAGKAVISLVAVSEGEVMGHVLFSPVTLDPPNAGFTGVGLGPVAVSPEFQRQGIGSRLIREGLDRCRQMGFEAVVVLGDPRYYSRFGFKRAGSFGLGNDYNADEHFMALELKEGALHNLRGVVKYAPEFDEAGA